MSIVWAVWKVSGATVPITDIPGGVVPPTIVPEDTLGAVVLPMDALTLAELWWFGPATGRLLTGVGAGEAVLPTEVLMLAELRLLGPAAGRLLVLPTGGRGSERARGIVANNKQCGV